MSASCVAVYFDANYILLFHTELLDTSSETILQQSILINIECDKLQQLLMASQGILLYHIVM